MKILLDVTEEAKNEFEALVGKYQLRMQEIVFEPNWRSAPPWAMYWAMDEDGMTCWFEEEPMFEVGIWVLKEDTRMIPDRTLRAAQELFASICIPRTGILRCRPEFEAMKPKLEFKL